jgi:hypothetical protein
LPISTSASPLGTRRSAGRLPSMIRERIVARWHVGQSALRGTVSEIPKYGTDIKGHNLRLRLLLSDRFEQRFALPRLLRKRSEIRSLHAAVYCLPQ